MLGIGLPLRAQDRATVRGAVVAAETGERIPYALVVLEPRFSQRFADDAGAFVFLDVAPGEYHLLVRQVGFRPFDTTLTVASATPPLRIELARIAVELSSITVAAAGQCRSAGRPDPVADRQMATIFEQLALNAQRQAVLLDRYPFRYQVIRTMSDQVRPSHFSAGQPLARAPRNRVDTLNLSSSARWPYAPGRVVAEGPQIGGNRTRDVHLPVLADLADSLFQAWHCFSYAGTERVDGRTLIRLDFKAAEQLREPDVNGSAWLDPGSYQVLQVRVELTKVTRAAPGVSAWVASSTFREILPNVTVTDRMSATTTMEPTFGSDLLGRSEAQQLVNVMFMGARPGTETSP